jgi:ATP-dependent DNA ligase
MFKAFEFCIPTTGTKVPHGPEWLHEIKQDGFRLRVERDGDRVRLITKGGYDWTKRYPWIVEAALKNRTKHFVIDGEAVILGVDGVSDFDALHSGKHNEEVQLCAFDMLAMDGEDLRRLPLSMGAGAGPDAEVEMLTEAAKSNRWRAPRCHHDPCGLPARGCGQASW